MSDERFDVAILGAGPGGEHAAYGHTRTRASAAVRLFTSSLR
jgi:flavin-dependent dehydrogenase